MHPATRRSLWLALTVITVFLCYCSPTVCTADDITLWEDACAKIDAGDLAGATASLNQLLAEYPDSPKAPAAQLKLAYIKIRTSPSATQEILDAFALVRTKYPSSVEAGEALARIGYLRSKTDAAQAISDFTDFLASYPSHRLAADVQQSLGRLYVRTVDLDKAEAAFDQVSAMPGCSTKLTEEAALQSGFVKIMKFYASREDSHLAAAITALGNLTSSSSVKVRARADLGIAEATLLQGKSLDARAKYQAAAQAYSGYPYFKGLALYGAAVSSHQAGEYAAGTEGYAAFLAAQSGSTLADKDTAWKAAALASTSLSAQASVQKDGAWERLPASDIVPKAAYLRGESLYLLARFTEAEQQFAEVLAAFPDGEIAGQAQAALVRAQMAKGGQ